MAARYVRIGQHPDYRDEIRGTLAEILASTANPGTYAAPEDVTGTYLEMGSDGLWTGASVGYLTKAQADALAASGALATLKLGTQATVNGQQVTWSGAAVGWAPALCGPVYTSQAQFPDGADCVRIRAANPAVPKGWSWLEWDGVMWAPPSGEVVFSNVQTTELLNVTGLAAGVKVAIGAYAMPPAYMWPEGRQMWLRASFGSIDTVSTAAQSFGVTITSETVPSSSDYNNRILSQNTRAATQSFMSGIPSSVQRQFRRASTAVNSFEIGNVNHLPGDANAINGWPGRTVGVYSEGATKIMLDVTPGATTNVFKFYGAEVIA